MLFRRLTVPIYPQSHRASGRLIFLSVELSYFLFPFLLTALTAIQFRAELRTIFTRRFGTAVSLRLTRGSSWIWRSR